MTIDERKTINTAVIQNLILENRGKLSISGVLDVLSFDDQVIIGTVTTRKVLRECLTTLTNLVQTLLLPYLR